MNLKNQNTYFYEPVWLLVWLVTLVLDTRLFEFVEFNASEMVSWYLQCTGGWRFLLPDH